MSNNNAKKKRLCHCRWPNCEKLKFDILNKSDISHVWADSLIRFQFPTRDPNLMSINKLAFYKSLCLHVLSNDNIKKVPTAIFLYPHHFPSAILQWQRTQDNKVYFTKPLSSSDAKEIQGRNNCSQSLNDNSNTVTYYHNKAMGEYKDLSQTKLNEIKFKNQYIKSPLTLPHEVENIYFDI